MTEQDLIHKIEWVNKRCSLKGEPLTQSQIELLKFVFADTVVNKNFDLADVVGRSEQVTCSCGIPPAIRLCEGVETCLKCGERLSK
jgi:hypothetical protein